MIRVCELSPLFCGECGDLMTTAGYQPTSTIVKLTFRTVVCKNSHCAQFDYEARIPVDFKYLEKLARNERRSEPKS